MRFLNAFFFFFRPLVKSVYLHIYIFLYKLQIMFKYYINYKRIFDGFVHAVGADAEDSFKNIPVLRHLSDKVEIWIFGTLRFFMI